MKEDGLPRIVAIPGNADHRERITLAEQARELDTAPLRRGRIAVLHVGHRLEQRAGEEIGRRGAPFFADIVRGTKRLPTEVEEALWQLVAAGLVTADGFDALRSLIEIGRSGPLARFLDKPFKPDRHDLDDDALAEEIRENTQTLYHPVGTCAMGTGEHAVVDPTLKVRGVDGLRVVDASIMPVVPRGNTNAPTIMVAEKAADLIRGR